MMGNFPDDILSELIVYTEDNFRDYLSSGTTLRDVAGDGISYWDIFENAIFSATKENDAQMIKFCLDSLESRSDYNLELNANNYSHVTTMLDNNSHEPLLYFLEQKDLLVDESLKQYFRDYKTTPYARKNIATCVLDAYILNHDLGEDLLEKDYLIKKRKL